MGRLCEKVATRKELNLRQTLVARRLVSRRWIESETVCDMLLTSLRKRSDAEEWRRMRYELATLPR